MNLKTKSPWVALATVCLMFVAPIANATSVNLAFFGPTPETVDFSGGVAGQAVYVDGIVTVTGGNVVTGVSVANMPTPNYTNNGGGGNPAGGVLRIDFATAVSAVGMDVHYNNSPVQLRLFDSLNNLLDSIMGSPTNYGTITGFLGLDVGANLVSYALVDVPAVNSHDLYIDNIVYQAQGVPDEASMLGLLGLSLVGVALFRRKIAA